MLKASGDQCSSGLTWQPPRLNSDWVLPELPISLALLAATVGYRRDLYRWPIDVDLI